MGGGFLLGSVSQDMELTLKPILEDNYYSRWDYQRRGPSTTWDRQRWRSLWPGSSMMSGDPATPMTLLGNDAMTGGEYFEPPSIMGSGTQTTKFLRGTCLDSGSVAVAGAIVQGFVTATDTFVGEVTSAGDGTYSVGTNNLSSTAHYLVAYKAGSPDIAGTTANTLLPTNVDGT